jgi:AraC-like DNA-binding protein/quercetin dioxygenase-like cupin family protein
VHWRLLPARASVERMIGVESRALLQRFLPDHDQHAFVWKYAHAIGGRRPRHFHSEPELNLVVRGSATFGVGDRVVRIAQGDLLAFPSGQDHVLLAASPDLYLYAIGLDRDYSAKVLGSAHDPVTPLHVSLGNEELERVIDSAAAIVERPNSDQRAAEIWKRVHWLGRRAAPSSSLATHVLTRRALGLLATSPEVGLDALARETGAHPSEISRHFHRDMGMTLVRYRTRQRLLRLIRLVDRGEHDLMGAAITAGFGSYSQCHRTFRSELGCGPRQFFRSDQRDRMQLTYAR